MDIRTFAVRAGNATIGTLLIAACSALIPVPGVAWYAFSEAFSTENRYMDDDASVIAALAITLIAAVVYAVAIAPTIWKRRAFMLGPPGFDHPRRLTAAGPRMFGERKRVIAYVLGAAAVPVATVLAGAAWTLGDREAAARGDGILPALITFLAASLLYVLIAVPAIRKAKFVEPPLPRDPLEEAFAADAFDEPGMGIVVNRDPRITRYVTLGGVPGPFWERPDDAVLEGRAIDPPSFDGETDDPVIEIGPALEIDLAQIERWERGEDDDPFVDQFAPTESAIPAAAPVSVLDADPEFSDDDWFT